MSHEEKYYNDETEDKETEDEKYFLQSNKYKVNEIEYNYRTYYEPEDHQDIIKRLSENTSSLNFHSKVIIFVVNYI